MLKSTDILTAAAGVVRNSCNNVRRYNQRAIQALALLCC